MILNILGFNLDFEIKNNKLEELINLIVEVRQDLRKQRNFEISDKIRNKLKEIGIILEDTKEGTKWKII
jgi:cysteinyl-tRNA synthetase